MDCTALIDTGAVTTLADQAILEKMEIVAVRSDPQVQLRSASGHIIQVAYSAKLTFEIAGVAKMHWTYACRRLPYQIIIGFDFIREHGLKINGQNSTVEIEGARVKIQSGAITRESAPVWEASTMESRQQEEAREDDTTDRGDCFVVTLTEDIYVPPRTGMFVKALVDQRPGAANGLEADTAAVVEGMERGLTARLCEAPEQGEDGDNGVDVFNATDSGQAWQAGQRLRYYRGSARPQMEWAMVDGGEEKEGPKTAETRWDARDVDIGPLTTDRRERLLEMIKKNADCFSWNGNLGRCKLIQHRIELTSDEPVRRPAYRAAQQEKKIIEEEVREMLQKGVIEPSVSEYAAGVVLVPKKDGTMRFCVDYRGINEVTKPDHYPMPLTKADILDTMGDATIFTTLDCQQGYWQVEVAPEDRPKTAFRCHLGLYQFTRTPFGMRNSGATYQRLMTHVLSGYIDKFCHCFIDDVVVFSRGFEEHLEHLERVFERLRRADLKLKPKKCVFARTQVTYLGHLVSAGEIRPDPRNVQAIQQLAAPTTLQGVRSFVGMAAYYRIFIRDFSRRAAPLTALTKKAVPFEWGERQEEAFQDLKLALTTEPVLTLPDYAKPFVLMTDGSATGLGAVLGQRGEGTRERVIAYASRKTVGLEGAYSACELESLALVWAVKHFREYLVGRRTEVVTDHWALKWLLTLRAPNPRLQRWRLTLQEYDLVVVHRSGKSHRNADFLSRIHAEDGRGGVLTLEELEKLPSERQGEDSGPDEREEGEISTEEGGGRAEACGVRAMRPGDHEERKNGEEAHGPSGKTVNADRPEVSQHGGPLRPRPAPACSGGEDADPGIGRSGLLAAQERDPDCRELFAAVTEGLPVPSWAADHRFAVSLDGVLEEVVEDEVAGVVRCVVLPERLIPAAIRDAHAGHFKTKKTLATMRKKYFFRRMYARVHEYVRGCEVCQKKDKGRTVPAPLGDMPEPLGAWHTVAVDVMGPLPQTRRGKKYILVITDYLTRYVLAVAIPNQTAKTTAEVLVEKFMEYGLPERLITDNGGNFRSELVKEVCRRLGVTQLFTTPYHPQFDGLCERFNRTLASMLRAFVAEHQRDWDCYLPFVTHAYRAAVQDSTGETPFFLMFGRPCRAPLDILLRDQPKGLPDAAKEVARMKPEMVQRLHVAFQAVKKRLADAHARQKNVHDRKAKDKQFEVGEEVQLLDERLQEGETRKLHRPWKPGYRVLQKIGPYNYLVEHPSRRGQVKRVHVNRLKKVYPGPAWLGERETARDDGGEEGERNVTASQGPLEKWLEEERARFSARQRGPAQQPWCWYDEEDEEDIGEAMGEGGVHVEDPGGGTSQSQGPCIDHSVEQQAATGRCPDTGRMVPRRSARLRAPPSRWGLGYLGGGTHMGW